VAGRSHGFLQERPVGFQTKMREEMSQEYFDLIEVYIQDAESSANSTKN
jgi:hypothetical protein